MADAVKLKDVACKAIDSKAKELFEVNQKIWSKPELNFEEKYAHSVLTEFFESAGFSVEKTQAGLETAFRATTRPSDISKDKLLTVGILCEYDALPSIGHACGHNLIAEAGAGAAIGLQAALQASGTDIGQVVVLGTPAEEGGGGKVIMLDKGCFDDIDFCMMVHPKPLNCAYPSPLAIEEVVVTFHGHASHAAAFPWEGVNALDAAIMAYNSVSMLRQQIKPTWRVHGVITNGGVKPNIIPDKTSLNFYIRTPTDEELKVLHQKINQCFEGAAKATGCTVDINWDVSLPYSNLVTNKPLARLYQETAEGFGFEYLPKEKQTRMTGIGSTDMGNVSHVKPAIHPFYEIGSTHANHTREFAAAAKTQVAHEQTIKQAKILAMVAIDVMTNDSIWEQVQNDFKNSTA